jgi:amidohydrolase
MRPRPLALLPLLGLLALGGTEASAQERGSLAAAIDRAAAGVLPKVVAWRRDIHEHPELGNRETRTAAIVAAHLRQLGMEVRTGVAHTGVVGVLRGGRPGPVVALRADMDALPVTEEVALPFASKVRTQYNGQEVGVMHACGHDNHVAILMGVAEILAGVRAELPGTVKFIFQPAEEGPPAGERGGARMMLEEGAFDAPSPDAIFGLHVRSSMHAGHIGYRSSGAMAASDPLRIVVRGKQTHAAMPWLGTDPIVTAAQILLGLQTVVSRQSDLTVAPAVVTVGIIQGGVRSNIIPDSVVMVGTIRTLDAAMRDDVHARVRRTAEQIAAAAGAIADVTISRAGVVLVNDPALTSWSVPTLERVAGREKVHASGPWTGAEDFALFAERVPGLYLFLGVVPPDQDPATVPTNHSPLFFADESALPVGVRALANLAADYLATHRSSERD